MDRAALEQLLRESVQAVKPPDVELDMQVSDEAEMQDIRTNLIVTFKPGGNAFLPLSRLLDRLRDRVTLGAVDVFGEPQNKVVVYGAAGGENFQIIIRVPVKR